MGKTTIYKNYKPVLSLYETQTAIDIIHKTFEECLAAALNLKRVSAPLFVEARTGLNDNLNGHERPVEFDIAHTNLQGQVVHSLAKWKRMALHQYGFKPGEGLYTNMNAIRRDEVMDNLHSIYVDQWDWERVLGEGERTVEFLKYVVARIVNAICDTSERIKWTFPQLSAKLTRDVRFITAQELEDRYPALTPKERENAITRECGTVFIMQIGAELRSGTRHDGRAPDYDDWQLNGDILMWSGVLDCAVELSSMGIRVDPQSMDSQLSKAGCDDRRGLVYHKMLLGGELPLTIGGGIGQSRLCMLIMEKAHVGEVQVSVWDEETIQACRQSGIVLL